MHEYPSTLLQYEPTVTLEYEKGKKVKGYDHPKTDKSAFLVLFRAKLAIWLRFMAVLSFFCGGYLAVFSAKCHRIKGVCKLFPKKVCNNS